MFNYFTEKGYKVIYKRPKNTEFTLDNNEQSTINQNIGNISAYVDGTGIITDYKLCEYYEDVYLFDDIVKQYPNHTYNEIQLSLFSNAKGFVSMGGGNGIFCSLFGKPNITYVTTSKELRPGYFDGDCYYKKLSNAEVMAVLDPETDIIERGYRDYEELYKLMKEVFK